MSISSKIKHILAQTAYIIIKKLVPVRKGRVYCEAFAGLQYSCNPKYITETILREYPNVFQIIWSFQNPQLMTGLDERIVKVKRRSFKDFFYFTTAEFIISNIRLNDCNWGWIKRKDQKYIMTWHGSMALKRVEFDAEEQLPASYMKKAIEDSKQIDLTLSDSVWCTAFMKSAFKYNGTILEKGLPRNDVFLQADKLAFIRNRVRQYYHINEKEKILLYAPTFRVDKSIDNYIFQWQGVLSVVESQWASKFKIMIRLHPNMMGVVDPSPMLTLRNCVDVTKYPDMQELLCAADILITDYSSSMFEFAIKKSPCFLYTPDSDSYDRGFYFQLETLPFPVSKNIDELIEQVRTFEEEEYVANLNSFYNNVFKYFQLPNSSLKVVDWMQGVSI